MKPVPGMTPLVSSALEAAAYDPEAQELHVKFRGGSTYTYAGVLPDVGTGLFKAESAGQYLARHVTARHRSTRRR
jgi:KTSC domain